MRAFVFELTEGELRKEVDKKLIDELRENLFPDEIYWLEHVAKENLNKGGIKPC